MGALSLRYSERLIMRFGAKHDAAPGHRADRASASLLFARAPVDGNYVADVLPVDAAARRSASGVCFPALMTLAMSGATPEDAGLASGLVNTTAQVGGALGPGGARHASPPPARRPARRRRVARPRR